MPSHDRFLCSAVLYDLPAIHELIGVAPSSELGLGNTDIQILKHLVVLFLQHLS